MRKTALVLVAVSVILSISLLAGCVLQKKAILQVTVSPSIIYLGKVTVVTITLKELNGVGIDLNYASLYVNSEAIQILTGQDARDFYIRAYGSCRLFPREELQNKSSYGPGTPGTGDIEMVFVTGGTDDNGNTMRTTATLFIRDKRG